MTFEGKYPFDGTPIKVGYRYYKVELVDYGPDNQRKVNGECDHDRECIGVQKTLTPQGAAACLMHELAHCCFNLFGGKIVNEHEIAFSEEHAVTVVSEGLATIFTDNPKLLVFFHEVWNL